MPKALKLILRDTPTGMPPTPKQSAQREKFARVAGESKEVFKYSKLHGADKVRAMNRWTSERLRG